MEVIPRYCTALSKQKELVTVRPASLDWGHIGLLNISEASWFVGSGSNGSVGI